jgi:hypothetical protein
MDFNDTISITQEGSYRGEIISHEGHIVCRLSGMNTYTAADLREIAAKLEALESDTKRPEDGA